MRWAGLLPIAGVAAFVSYRHLSGLLAHYGEEPLVYYIGPLAVDGLMIMATAALVAGKHAAKNQAAASVESVTVPPAPLLTQTYVAETVAPHQPTPESVQPPVTAPRPPARTVGVVDAPAVVPATSVASQQVPLLEVSRPHRPRPPSTSLSPRWTRRPCPRSPPACWTAPGRSSSSTGTTPERRSRPPSSASKCGSGSSAPTRSWPCWLRRTRQFTPPRSTVPPLPGQPRNPSRHRPSCPRFTSRARPRPPSHPNPLS